MEKEHSCGAILYCYEENIRKYVLVMEANGAYGFPKGHKEGNETDIETATREIMEETGVVPSFIPNLKRTICYKIANDIEKEVIFFVAKYENQELKPKDKGILAIQKVDLSTALNLLKFSTHKNILIETDYILDMRGE